MKKILIVTCSYDLTVDYMIEKYKTITEFFRFNVDRFSDYKIIITESYWEIIYGFNRISSENILSIYYRKPAFPDTSDFDLEYRRIINSDILSIVDGIVNSFSGVVLTKPQILRRTENKIFQLIYAQKNAILTPKSFIGNNSFFECINNPRVIKPISIGKITTENGISVIQTNIMHENDEYDDIELTPIYVQEYVEKDYEVRITVVDDEFYAVKIISDNLIDWRAGDNNRYELIDTPPEVKKCVKKMMCDFKLRFGAVDYVVDKAGKWYFLEINPNGQWQWLECNLKLTISDSIINLLLGERIL